MPNKKIIFLLQFASVAFIWVFITAILFWIVNMILVAHRLNDALDASVAISIIAMPVYVSLASLLTYVFVGLQKGKNK